MFSVLYGLWVANFLAFNGDLCAILRLNLSLGEKQGDVVALMNGHNVMGTSLLLTGEIAEARLHLDQAVALYDPAKHRALATRLGQDSRVAVLAYRAIALWVLGFPDAARADVERMLTDAEIGQAAIDVCAAVRIVDPPPVWELRRGKCESDECITLAEEKEALF